jgi:hypothetical protein
MNIHDRARQMVTQAHGEMALSEAYRALALRRRRACRYGVLHVSNADRRQFATIETPCYAWQQRADLQ